MGHACRSLYITLFLCLYPQDRNSLSCMVRVRRLHYSLRLLYPLCHPAGEDKNSHSYRVCVMHAGVYITLFSLFLPSAGEDRNSLSCRIWIRRLHYTLFLCLIPPFLPPRRVTHMISTLVISYPASTPSHAPPSEREYKQCHSLQADNKQRLFTPIGTNHMYTSNLTLQLVCAPPHPVSGSFSSSSKWVLLLVQSLSSAYVFLLIQ